MKRVKDNGAYSYCFRQCQLEYEDRPILDSFQKDPSMRMIFAQLLLG